MRITRHFGSVTITVTEVGDGVELAITDKFGYRLNHAQQNVMIGDIPLAHIADIHRRIFAAMLAHLDME